MIPQVIEGYDHFRESRCNMFDQEEINRWNAMMWANERAREVEMGQFAMQVGKDGSCQGCSLHVVGSVVAVLRHTKVTTLQVVYEWFGCAEYVHRSCARHC